MIVLNLENKRNMADTMDCHLEIPETITLIDKKGEAHFQKIWLEMKRKTRNFKARLKNKILKSAPNCLRPTELQEDGVIFPPLT